MSKEEELAEIEKPPFFKKWSQMYGFVVGWLIVLIMLFYFFSQTYG